MPARRITRYWSKVVAGGAAWWLAVTAAGASPESERGRALMQLDLFGSRSSETFVRAVFARHRPLVDLFLAARTDVNASGEAGRTALHAAALLGEADLTGRLLSLGADPHRADDSGITPLMLAAVAGHLPTIAALRERGASLQAVDSAGRSALHYAVAAQRAAVLVEFFKTPAELEPVLGDSTGLAGLAAATGNRALMELVLLHLPRKAEWSAPARAWFSQALQNRDADLLRLFLANFSGPPAPDAGAQPWLAYAIATEDLALLDFLLKCGSDPNAVLEAPDDTALREKIRAGFMRYYLQSEPGLTPLMLAAGLGNTGAVRLLLAAGARRGLATTGKSRLVALYFACWADSPACTQALLEDAPPRDRTRIEISLNAQRATFYKDGAVVLETPVSTGRAGFATRPGDYIITDKHLTHTSSLYREARMPFFMRLSCKDFGLHEGHVTGRPASHGCVRLPKLAARRLYTAAPLGTWVSITQ